MSIAGGRWSAWAMMGLMMNTPSQPTQDENKATAAERLIVMVRAMREVPIEDVHFRDYLELCRLLQDVLFYLHDATVLGWGQVPSAGKVSREMLKRAQKSQLPVGPAYREPGEEPPKRQRPTVTSHVAWRDTDHSKES